MSLLTMIQKLVASTQPSFTISRPRSVLLLSFGELPSLYVQRLISRSRTRNSGLSLSLILHLFCLCLKQMPRTVCMPTSLLWMMLPSQRCFLCLLFVPGLSSWVQCFHYPRLVLWLLADPQGTPPQDSILDSHWLFCAKPFCVKNAPVVFARLMEDIMNDLQWNAIAICLDNIIIGGKNCQEQYDRSVKGSFRTTKWSRFDCQGKQGVKESSHSWATKSQLTGSSLTLSNWVLFVIGHAPWIPKNCEHSSVFATTKFINNFDRIRLKQLTGKSNFIWALERKAAFNVLSLFFDMSKPFELSTDTSDTQTISCPI